VLRVLRIVCLEYAIAARVLGSVERLIRANNQLFLRARVLWKDRHPNAHGGVEDLSLSEGDPMSDYSVIVASGPRQFLL